MFYKEHLVIDGYNVIHQNVELRCALQNFGWAAATDRLISLCLAVLRADIYMTVVFDGNGERNDINNKFGMKNFRVIFSSGNFSADAIIEKIIANTKRPTKCVVVTNDSSIAQAVFSNNACVMRADDFFKDVSTTKDVLTSFDVSRGSSSKWKLIRAFDDIRLKQ